MWKISWDQASQQVQENLRFLDLALSLRRALDDLDLVLIQDILRSAAQVQMLEHPLFTQALELLERASS